MNYYLLIVLVIVKCVYIAKYLPVAYKNGSDKEARGYVALANTYAGFYMMCTSLHTMEHVMGSFHKNLVHGAGLIMLSRAYFNFFIEKGAGEESFIKMARAMGRENVTSAKDFLTAFDAFGSNKPELYASKKSESACFLV